VRSVIIKMAPLCACLLLAPEIWGQVRFQNAMTNVRNAVVLVSSETGKAEIHGPGLLVRRRDNQVYVVTGTQSITPPDGKEPHEVWVRYNDGAITRAEILARDFIDGLSVIRITYTPYHNPLDVSQRFKQDKVITGYLWGYPLHSGTVHSYLLRGRYVPNDGIPADFKHHRTPSGELSELTLAYRESAGRIDGSPGTSAVDHFGDWLGMVTATKPDRLGDNLVITPAARILAALDGTVKDFSLDPVPGRRGHFTVSGSVIDPLSTIAGITLMSTYADRSKPFPKQGPGGSWPALSDDLDEQPLRIVEGQLTGEIRLRPRSAQHDNFYCQLKFTQSGRNLPRYGRPRVVGVWGEEGSADPWTTEADIFQKPYHFSEDRKLQPPSVTQIAFDGRGTVEKLFWSADQRYVVVVSRSGVVSKIMVPTLEVSSQIDLDRRCTDVVECAMGFAILVDEKEIWVVDERTMQVVRRVKAPGTRAMACGKKAYEILTLTANRGEIRVVSLLGHETFAHDADHIWRHQHEWIRKHPASEEARLREFDYITVSPNGRHLLVASEHVLHRFEMHGNKLTYKELSPPIGEHPARITFTDDSRFFGFINVSDQLIPDHPPVGFGSYIYDTLNVQEPLLTLNFGAQPRALGFSAGIIYAQNKDHKLIRYSPKSGARDAYRLETRGRTLAILPYPSSSEERVLLLTETDLLWVDFDAN
jgi:hypothetical protein